MQDDIVVREDLRIPAFELTERASRSGGPGGQHVNKTSTRVELRWNVAGSVSIREDLKARVLAKLRTRLTVDGDLVVVVDTSRSQLQNRLEARERLAEIVRRALIVEKKRVATKPTAGANRRRLTAKKRASGVKASRQWDADDE